MMKPLEIDNFHSPEARDAAESSNRKLSMAIIGVYALILITIFILFFVVKFPRKFTVEQVHIILEDNSAQLLFNSSKIIRPGSGKLFIALPKSLAKIKTDTLLSITLIDHPSLSYRFKVLNPQILNSTSVVIPATTMYLRSSLFNSVITK